MSIEKEREEMMKTIKEEAEKDIEKYGPVQRFALFSQPPPLGIGDNSYDFKERHPRDENGKPLTEKPNVAIKAPFQGKVKSSYFSVLGFTTINDKYIDPSRVKQLDALEEKKKIKNDAIFKPASGFKEIIVAPYNHQTEIDPKAKKRYHRSADGRVITAPPNINTNPEARNLFKFRQHEKDEYDRKHQYDKKNWEDSKKLMKEAPFKSTIAGGENFNSDRKTFGLEKSLPPKRAPREAILNILKHEMPFKPSHPPKSGHNGFLAPFPKYQGNPIKPVTRKDIVKTKDPFKPNHSGGLTRPTPSITCYGQNIRREMMSKGI